MITQADLDIIIPFYRGHHLIIACVNSLLSISDAKVRNIVVVDDSVDPNEAKGAADVCLKHFLAYYKTPKNLGFIGATEYGVSRTNRPFILFMNSDIRSLEWGSLEEMLSLMEDEQVVIVGAKLLFPPERGSLSGHVQHAGVATNADGIPYHPFRGELPDHLGVNQLRSVNGVTGGCFLVRRSFFEAQGGWDKQLGKGVYEDVDLCRQAIQAGKKVMYQPEAVFYHWESASVDSPTSHNLHNHVDENLKYLINKWGDQFRNDEALFGVEPQPRLLLDERLMPLWPIRDNPIANYILELWTQTAKVGQNNVIASVVSLIDAITKEKRTAPVMVPEIAFAQKEAEVISQLQSKGFTTPQIGQVMSILTQNDDYPAHKRRKRR